MLCIVRCWRLNSPSNCREFSWLYLFRRFDFQQQTPPEPAICCRSMVINSLQPSNWCSAEVGNKYFWAELCYGKLFAFAFKREAMNRHCHLPTFSCSWQQDVMFGFFTSTVGFITTTGNSKSCWLLSAEKFTENSPLLEMWFSCKVLEWRVVHLSCCPVAGSLSRVTGRQTCVISSSCFPDMIKSLWLQWWTCPETDYYIRHGIHTGRWGGSRCHQNIWWV